MNMKLRKNLKEGDTIAFGHEIGQRIANETYPMTRAKAERLLTEVGF